MVIKGGRKDKMGIKGGRKDKKVKNPCFRVMVGLQNKINHRMCPVNYTYLTQPNKEV